MCCLFAWAGLGASCPAWDPPAEGSAEPSGSELFAPPPPASTKGDAAALPRTGEADQEPAKADQTKVKAGDADAKADEPEATAEDQAEPIAPSRVEPEVLPELGPEMAALRDRVRQTLAAGFSQPPGTQESTPTEIIQHCLAFGCDATVRNAADGNRPINAVGCLAWNFTCGGHRLMTSDGRRLIARVGYGLQQRPGEFLAVLAQAGVPDDYEVRAGEHHGRVADLVEYEKLDCRRGADLSAKLIGLSFYVEADQTWKNQLGETWSLERIVELELDRQVQGGKTELTDQLLGLAYAVNRRVREKSPLDGQFARAKDYVAEFQAYALELQNPDGSWHPRIFAVKGTSSDAAGLLRSNGRILEWLASSLPKDRLGDPQVVSSVAYVTGLLNGQSSQRRSASVTTAEIVDRMHALRALSLYDQRYLKPRDRREPAAEAEAKKGVTRR